MRVKRCAAAILAAMLLLTGCGEKEAVVEDYGTGEATEVATESGTVESSSEEDSTEENNLAGGTLSEKLGGKELAFKDEFTVGSKTAKIDVRYPVQETDNLCSYKVNKIKQSDIKEDEIVKNLFGDTAKKIIDDGRDTLSEDQGDSYFIVYSNMYADYYNGIELDGKQQVCPAWIDGDDFYVHNYEGDYNSISYELMIGYSSTLKEMYIAFYPKKISDITGDANLNYYETTNPDGMFYMMTKGKALNYNIPEVMADRPNKCTLHDDELMSKVKELLEDKLYLPYPEASLSFYANRTNIDPAVEPMKCEALFYNPDEAPDDTFSGGMRDGYGCTFMTKFCNQSILQNAELQDGLYYYNEKKQTIYVNDDGVFAFDMIVYCSFDEMISDDVQLLSFEDAMKAFMEQAEKNISVDSIKNSFSELYFRNAYLTYYQVPSGEGSDEYTFSPVWVVEADSDRGTLVRVLINASDGSLVDIFY